MKTTKVNIHGFADYTVFMIEGVLPFFTGMFSENETKDAKQLFFKRLDVYLTWFPSIQNRLSTSPFSKVTEIPDDIKSVIEESVAKFYDGILKGYSPVYISRILIELYCQLSSTENNKHIGETLISEERIQSIRGKLFDTVGEFMADTLSEVGF